MTLWHHHSPLRPTLNGWTQPSAPSVMLTPSVNIVRSSFPEERQGEICGVSRSVSNLGSCLGTAIGGTILVSGFTDHACGLAMVALGVIGLIGLAAAISLGSNPDQVPGTRSPRSL